MNNFLNHIAQWLHDQTTASPSETWIVFPNRRSGVYFMKHYSEVSLSKNKNKPVWLPKVLTINEFLNGFSALRIAEPIELMASLYSCYLKESSSQELFDSFYSWGEMMLRDYNDVDKYLVNAELVFSNVADYKNMDGGLEYLSEEQLAIIQRFFSSFSELQQSVLKEKFLEIWKILLPVYNRFKQHISEQNLGYEGMIYRDALQNIQASDAKSFLFKKVYFAGFNAITPCEEKIFEVLKNRDLAGFFWDYDHYYITNEYIEAGVFQRKYLKMFPSEPGFTMESTLIDPTKKITVVSVPTDSGQVFKAAQILSTIDSPAFSNTSLVLADENLLFPAMSLVPSNIDQINITMGFPIGDSSTGNFLQTLIQMQLNAKTSSSGEVSFYYKNVLSVLQHPFLQKTEFQKSFDLVQYIKKNNLFQLQEKELAVSELLISLFRKVDSITSFPSYLKDIFLNLLNAGWNSETDSRLLMEKEFFFNVILKVNQLTDQIAAYKLNMFLPTYFQMIRKVLSQIRIPFEGEPISGLQLMGFLETRNLDFEEVIILSVNEGVLPTSMHSPSFIPYSLRKGFGLPTRELHDAMYAYYFYRLLQRAKRVWLIYNSGVGGLVSGEKSRFIHQLQFDSNFNVETINVNQTIEVITRQSISIKKEGAVALKLDQFLETDVDKNLSPSALSIYLTCPLRFYFKSVAGIKEPDEMDEQIDARLFGSIFHLVSEKFYRHFFDAAQLITEQALAEIEKDSGLLDAWIKDSFKEILMGKNSKKNFEVSGKNHIAFDVIRKYLYQLIRIDKKNAPFSIVGLEMKMQMQQSFNSNHRINTVAIGGFIDRIDRTNNGLRIIDYKTGKDKLVFTDLQDLFSGDKIKNNKAVFQTFAYSSLVAKHYPQENYIWPMVYQVVNFFDESKSFSVKSDKYTPFASGNFKAVEMEFDQSLKNLLTEIFSYDIPFTQTEEIENCEYCPYKLICGR